MLEKDSLVKLQEIQKEILREFHDFCEENNLVYVAHGGTLIGVVRHQGVIPWDDDIDIDMPIDDYYRFLEISQNKFNQNYFIQHYSTDPNFPHQFIRIRKNNTLSVQETLKEFDIHHGVFIDVFPLNQLPSHKFEQRFYLSTLNVLKRIKYVFYPNPEFVNKGLLKGAIGRIIRIIPKNKWYKFKDIVREMFNKRKSGPTTKYFDFTLEFSSENFRRIHLLKTEIEERSLAKFDGIDIYIPKDYHTVLTRFFGDYMSYPEVEDQIPHHGIVEFSEFYDGEDYRTK